MVDEPPCPTRKSTSAMRIRHHSGCESKASVETQMNDAWFAARKEAAKTAKAEESAVFKVPLVPKLSVETNSLKKSASNESNASSKGSWSAGLIQHFEQMSRCALSKSETSLPTPRIKNEPRASKSALRYIFSAKINNNTNKSALLMEMPGSWKRSRSLRRHQRLQLTLRN